MSHCITALPLRLVASYTCPNNAQPQGRRPRLGSWAGDVSVKACRCAEAIRVRRRISQLAPAPADCNTRAAPGVRCVPSIADHAARCVLVACRVVATLPRGARPHDPTAAAPSGMRLARGTNQTRRAARATQNLGKVTSNSA